MKRFINSVFLSLQALCLSSCAEEGKYVLHSPDGSRPINVGQSDEGDLYKRNNDMP